MSAETDDRELARRIGYMLGSIELFKAGELAELPFELTQELSESLINLMQPAGEHDGQDRHD